MIKQPPLVKPVVERPSSLWDTAHDYLRLTKPPIVILLVITAIGAMFVAAQGAPPLDIMALVCIGGSLGAGGANALNHYLDRDIDELMGRTRERPLPGRRVSPRNALIFGVVLNVIAFALLTIWVNWLAAMLTLIATLFYVFIYTRWLKRSTSQNIVIGGAAGAIPPLVGWAGITGGLDLPAVYLFSIIFFWTPPHFWALALLIQRDYERAGVPMLPVVASREETVTQIWLYTIALVGLTIMFALTDAVSWVYFASALVLGGIFLLLAWRLKEDSAAKNARTLYLYSLLYLALLFVSLMVDSAAHL